MQRSAKAVCVDFTFSIGTILTYVLLTGLPDYFDSVDQINAAK